MAKVQTKENKVTTAEAHVRSLRISPRKVRLVTNMVKNMWADEALVQLKFTNKKAARYVHEAVKSAMANAINNFNLNKDQLVITSITCDQGPVLKRFMPRAQGRATPLRKPTSHLHVILTETNKKRKGKGYGVTFKGRDRAKVEEKEAETAEVEEKNQAKLQNQNDRAESKVKETKGTTKRRIFNRKSGV